MNAVLKPVAAGDSVITDISLADWGRKEIRSPSRAPASRAACT